MEKPKHGGCYGGIVSSSLFAVVFLSLLLQPSAAQPEITIEKFTVTTLKEVTNSSNTVNFEIKFLNFDPYPIDYNTLNFTFYYKPNNTTILPIGNATFKPFYLRNKGRSTRRAGTIEDGASNFGNNVTTAPPAVFRVELVTSIRYEYSLIFKSKWQRYVVGANLNVDGQGNLIKRKHNKGIPLTSGVGRNYMNCSQLMFMLLISLFFFHSL